MSEPQTTTEPLITTKQLVTTQLLATTTDQTDTNISPLTTYTATNAAPSSTLEDENPTTPSDSGTHTPPTTINLKGATSTMPEGSLLTTSATTVNKLTRTTESLDEDIDHFTIRDQTSTGIVSEKKNDVSVHSKLALILSATNLAMFLVLAVVVLLVVVHLCVCKGKAKESKSAKIKLVTMTELTTQSVSPAHTFNADTSPVHYCSKEKVDLM